MVNNTNHWITANFTTDLVSVIIPSYNRHFLLKEAIQSIVDQTYRPIECIVIDDGSTDGTANMVSKYISELNTNEFKLKYIYQQNSGAQVARNTATLASSGEFIQYLDSDDLLYPDKIKTQVDFFRSKTECDAVFGDWDAGFTDKNQLTKAYAKEDLLEQMLTERCVSNFSLLMKRHLVSLIGPWDTSLKRNQEIDYHLRGLLANSTYCYYAINTGLHRRHKGEQITTTTGNKEILQFYKKWEKILKEHDKFTNAIQNKFANLYVWYFLQKPNSEPLSLELLEDAMRLNPKHSIFSSPKLQFVRKCIGSRMALRLWLMRFFRNRQKESGNEN